MRHHPCSSNVLNTSPRELCSSSTYLNTGGVVSDRAAKDALFDGFAGVAKALGSGRRAAIADLLSQGERSVDEIATELGQSVANTSQHLQQLLPAALVRTRLDGTPIYY